MHAKSAEKIQSRRSLLRFLLRALIYEEVKLDCGYRADLIVEKKLIVEVRAVESLNEIH